MRATTTLSIAAVLGSFACAASAQYSLTIMHTNDMHSRIEPINKYDSTCKAEDDLAGKCFGGSARLKAKVAERRAAMAGKNVLLLDAGDQFQGSLFYTTYKGRAAVEFMNAIGYDAMAVGNHEFDDGPDGLANLLNEATFPVLSGNVDVSSSMVLKDRLAPYTVIELGGEKIGVVGAVAEDTAELSSPGPDVVIGSVEDAMRRAVADLEGQGVTKIVALTHIGFNRDKEVAATVRGIDAIVGGHSNTFLSNTSDRAAGPYPTMVRNPDGVDVPIVSAYAYAKYLGELQLVFDDAGTVVSASGEPHLLDAGVSPDDAIVARVNALAGPINELKRKVVAATAAPIDGDRASCRTRECEMGNLVAEAMLDRVRDQGIQIAIQNGGGLRASIDAGEVTVGEVLSVLPFQNTLSTFLVKGSDVIAALENGVSQVEDVKGRFPQVAGLRFSWTRSVAPKEGRIKKVEVEESGDWVPIDPERVYGVATNNFVRNGGDGYDVFETNAAEAYDYGPGVEVVVSDYLAANAPYRPFVDGRITEE